MQSNPGGTENRKILVIIPAYNEEKNVGDVVRKVKTCCNADILVIDDCSADNTVAIAKAAGARVISLLSNMGYGVAIQAGYKYAIRYGYDCLVQIDGDGQHDPAYINVLLKEIYENRADLVIGSRLKGLKSYDMPLARRVGIDLFSRLVHSLVGQRIMDITSGMQAMNRKTINLFCSNLFPYEYPDADVILWCVRKGIVIAEVPVIMYNNTDKSMHSGIYRPAKYIVRMLASIMITRFLHTE